MKKSELILCNKEDCFGLIAKMQEHFSQENPLPLKAEISFHRKQRTNRQNAYLWGPLYDAAIDYFKENPVEMIQFILSSLKADFLSKELLHEVCKLRYLEGKSTTKNNTSEQNDYADSLREDMFHLYNLDIPLPNQPSMEAVR